MSALGHLRTLKQVRAMSALPTKADIPAFGCFLRGLGFPFGAGFGFPFGFTGGFVAGFHPGRFPELAGAPLPNFVGAGMTAAGSGACDESGHCPMQL
jgi:hypothetical protein